MMSAARDEEEPLAEILREILALSETKQPNQSKSTVANNSVKLFDTQSGKGDSRDSHAADETGKRGVRRN